MRRASTGDLEGATAGDERAVAILAELAAADPGRHARGHGIALLSLAHHRRIGSNPDSALEVARRAISVLRSCRLAEPTATDHHRDLAKALVMFSSLAAVPNEAAREAVAEAIALRRQVPRGEPDLLAPDLLHQARLLAAAGRYEEAVAAGGEALDRARAIVSVPGSKPPIDVAAAHLAHGRNLAESGREAEALVALDEAVRQYRARAAADPASPETPLAITLAHLADKTSTRPSAWPGP